MWLSKLRDPLRQSTHRPHVGWQSVHSEIWTYTLTDIFMHCKEHWIHKCSWDQRGRLYTYILEKSLETFLKLTVWLQWSHIWNKLCAKKRPNRRDRGWGSWHREGLNSNCIMYLNPPIILVASCPTSYMILHLIFVIPYRHPSLCPFLLSSRIILSLHGKTWLPQMGYTIST